MGVWDGVTERRETRQNKLDQIHIAIFGNGHPEDGLVWKVKGNTDFIKVVEKVFWKVLTLTIVGCVGAIGSFFIAVFKLVYHVS